MRPFHEDHRIRLLQPDPIDPNVNVVPLIVEGDGPCSVEGIEIRGGMSLWAKRLFVQWTWRDRMWECDLRLLAILPDRDDPTLMVEVGTGNCAHYDVTDIVPARDWLIWRIYGLLMEFARHEVMESLLVDGVRPHEPHRQTDP